MSSDPAIVEKCNSSSEEFVYQILFKDNGIVDVPTYLSKSVILGRKFSWNFLEKKAYLSEICNFTCVAFWMTNHLVFNQYMLVFLFSLEYVTTNSGRCQILRLASMMRAWDLFCQITRSFHSPLRFQQPKLIFTAVFSKQIQMLNMWQQPRFHLLLFALIWMTCSPCFRKR